MSGTTKRGAKRAASGAPNAHRQAGLATYRAKRDFSRSPEPRGGRVAAARGTRFFCVQKHLASHLHYDFRLEHRGVLLSWAVPKGPSPDPAVKRLAMAVEDHPRDYGTFEGVIPDGYGAGIVLLWDAGSWEPLVDDVDAALAAGSLPFVVLGEKLQGAWTLIRARRAGEKSWLLIKKRDRWSGTSDPTIRSPLSVKSGGDLSDILAASGADPWPGGPPVRSGATGALYRAVLRDAAALKRRAPTR